ncbi:cuticle protein 16.5-like isoform X2 [Bacillus rossius redtenbacheri]|uniref:cuticle protein 16.5-like isoform X2 n=1 Tax=Bacillus rossius redtenbacheri TaxID=93214 RepID=UPI002FDCE1F6
MHHLIVFLAILAVAAAAQINIMIPGLVAYDAPGMASADASADTVAYAAPGMASADTVAHAAPKMASAGSAFLSCQKRHHPVYRELQPSTSTRQPS